jgi:hypothetical protein
MERRSKQNENFACGVSVVSRSRSRGRHPAPCMHSIRSDLRSMGFAYVWMHAHESIQPSLNWLMH